MSVTAARQVIEEHKAVLRASLDLEAHTESEIIDKIEKNSQSLQSASPRHGERRYTASRAAPQRAL